MQIEVNHGRAYEQKPENNLPDQLGNGDPVKGGCNVLDDIQVDAYQTKGNDQH